MFAWGINIVLGFGALLTLIDVTASIFITARVSLRKIYGWWFGKYKRL